MRTPFTTRERKRVTATGWPSAGRSTRSHRARRRGDGPGHGERGIAPSPLARGKGRSHGVVGEGRTGAAPFAPLPVAGLAGVVHSVALGRTIVETRHWG